MKNISNKLILFIILLGIVRLLHCVIAKKYDLNIYPPCPLSSNGIKNTIIIQLCLIIIILLLKNKKYF